MGKSKILQDKRDVDLTNMACHVWFLRFLHKFGNRGDSYEDICMRLITSKKLDPEDSKKLKQEMANYEKFL